ncbi:MAG: sel1 repeat family protein [Lentisphaerae bacterium]|nr:sel1 repeat family protein [Lentisphaerota bacterium]
MAEEKAPALLSARDLNYHVKRLGEEGKNDELSALCVQQSRLGSGRADILLGIGALHQNDLETAAEYFQQAVKKGSIEGDFYLATLIKGDGSDPGKVAEAFQIYKRLAGQKVPEASFQAGIMLMDGSHGGEPDTATAIKYILFAAEQNYSEYDSPERQHSIAAAQLVMGAYYKENSQWEKAYEMLDKAVESTMINLAPAWRMLGVMYFAGNGLNAPRYDWAELCFAAAYRLEKDASTEFNLALCAAELGKPDKMFEYARLAAARGDENAKKLLSDKHFHQHVNDKRDKLAAEKQKSRGNAIAAAHQSYFDHSKKMLGTSAPEVFAELAGYTAKTGRIDMVRFPEKYQIPGWCLDMDEVNKELDKHLFKDRERDGRWMTDDFLLAPSEKNLAPLNPTIRAINMGHEDAAVAAMKKAGYRQLTVPEIRAMAQAVRASFKKYDKNGSGEVAPVWELLRDIEIDQEYAEVTIWQIRDDLYYMLMLDTSGRWQVRDYSFIFVQGDKYISLGDSCSPHGIAEAATIMGVLNLDLDSLCNLAVKLEEGDIVRLFEDEDTVEAILLGLDSMDHWGGSYNLGVFYLNRNKKELGEKYIKRAIELRKKSEQK